MSAAGARARVRAELTAEIKAAGRRHLAESGAAALSLRAVARDVGMVSSAVYRYFPSRDELLTALIVDSYLSLGDAVQVAAHRRGSVEHRFLACGHAVRDWAVARPHEWALLYGSPVPGYAARDTVDPAGVAPLALLGVVADGVATGAVRSVPGPLPRALRADLARLRADTGLAIPDDVLARALGAWAWLLGAVSVELFGHTNNVITDDVAFFETQQRQTWSTVAGWRDGGAAPGRCLGEVAADVATVPGMQDRPTAAELLEAVADSLDGEVLPVVDFTVQHKVRVAANICRIVIRELQLGADVDRREHDALMELLGQDGTLPELNAAATEHLRHADAAELPAAVDVLIDAVAGKLTINKPGYTS